MIQEIQADATTQQLLRIESPEMLPAFPAGPMQNTISITSDLSSIEGEWREFEGRADCTPFQTFAWLANWQRCIGARTGVTPVVVSARGQKGDLLFILPLAIERLRYGHCLTFLGRALSDYNAPLLSPLFSGEMTVSAFAELWKAVYAAIRRDFPHTIVLFDKMPAMVSSQHNPMLALRTVLNPSGAHSTELAADWERFYTQKRSADTRRNDRKKLRKLAELGAVAFVTADGSEAIRQLFGTLVAQKRHKFRQMGVSDLFAKPGYTEFFAIIAADASALVHVSALQVGSTAAAVNLGLMFRGSYYHILASYDDGPVARFGPGAAHLHELMRHAIAKGCRRFDFTIGDEGYKLEWSDAKLDLYDHVSGASVAGQLIATFMAANIRSKRFIKTSPVIWNLARKLRAAFALWRLN